MQWVGYAPNFKIASNNFVPFLLPGASANLGFASHLCRNAFGKQKDIYDLHQLPSRSDARQDYVVPILIDVLNGLIDIPTSCAVCG
jgi:hypothetical protein